MSTIYPNSIIWALPTSAAGSVSWPATGPLTETQNTYAFRNTALVARLNSLASRVTTHPETERYYRHVESDEAIEVMGKVRCMKDGRPKRWVEHLLRSCQTAISNTAYPYMFAAGLVYRIPGLMQKSADRYGVTIAGSALLEHYVKTTPEIEPFVKAYLNDSAKERVADNCVAFQMQLIPPEHKEIEARNVEINKALTTHMATYAAQTNQSAHAHTIRSASAQPPTWAMQAITNNTGQSALGSAISSLFRK